MATMQYRKRRRNSDGDYDIIHTETDASIVMMSDGSTTAEAAINSKATKDHTHDKLKRTEDVRDVVTKPSDYRDACQFVGIKSAGSLSMPYYTGYSWVIGLCGWGDDTGGKTYEIAFNDRGIFWRTGTDETWGCWNIMARNNFNDIDRTSDVNGVQAFVKDGGYNRAAYDFNNITADGIHECGSDELQTNTPYGSSYCHFMVMVLHHSSTYIRQVAFDVRTDAIYTRVQSNGTWYGWNKIHHGGCDELLLKGGIGAMGSFINTTDRCTYIDNILDGNNRIRIQMYCNLNGIASGRGFQCWKQVDGTFTWLGDIAPTQCSTTDIGAGATLESGCVYYVFE